jgi:hypothetical protein
MIRGLMSSPDHASSAGAPCAAPPDVREVPTAVGRRLSLLEGRFAVCRLPACAPWPVPRAGPLLSITRTAEETSVVCLAENAPRGARVEGGWRALKLEGPIPFEQVGVLSALSGSLAGAGLSLFALSTFDTDYILVKETDLAAAVDALRRAGFDVDGEVL